MDIKWLLLKVEKRGVEEAKKELPDLVLMGCGYAGFEWFSGHASVKKRSQYRTYPSGYRYH